MTEPDVALTDFALAVECAVFLWWLSRLSAPSPLRRWAMVFFAALVVAPLAGGLVHGFFLDSGSPGHRVLWPVTLMAIGLAAAGAWMIGAWLQCSPAGARRIGRAVALALVVYWVVVLFLFQSFVVAILFYLPAAVFLLATVLLRHARTGERAARLAAFGLILTFVASAVQIGRVALHPVYFNHNALYHAVQAIALALLYVALRDFIAGASRPLASPC
jgi:hypothetical protein